MSEDETKTVVLNRKGIHAAGILIIQPDMELAFSWQEALIDYGMTGVRVVGDEAAAIESARVTPPSGVVVALPNAPEAYDLIARLRDGEGGGLGDTPIALVMARATRSAVIAAATVGVDAVLPSPLHPRLIYRRMGSLMQRARRAARRRLSPHEPSAETRVEEAAEAN